MLSDDSACKFLDVFKLSLVDLVVGVPHRATIVKVRQDCRLVDFEAEVVGSVPELSV